MPARRDFLLLGTAFMLSGCARLVLEGATTPIQLSTEVVTKEINQIRAANGVGPLTFNFQLEEIAKNQAALMASFDVMSHDLGGNLSERVKAVGYEGIAAENIAVGQKTLEIVLIGWLNSPPHRKSLLSGQYTEFGLAAISAPTKKWRTYWALAVGRPVPAAFNKA